MILVTGGTGLLGAYLLADLARTGKKVRALKRKDSSLKIVQKVFANYAPACSLEQSIEWVEGDMMDIFDLSSAMQGVEHIYHCAAMVSFDSKDCDRMIEVNQTGTANIMNEALAQGIKKVCHVSSTAALGKPVKKEMITEDNWWKGSSANTWYAVSKYSAEREAWRASEEGLNVVIVNPSVILGAGDFSKGSSGIFSRAAEGMKFYATGSTGFVDARDVSKCMIQLMEGPYSGERYIITSENINFRDLFNQLHDYLGKKRPFIKAGKFLTALAWRAEFLRCAFSGTAPLITRETARASQRSYDYSNQKIKQTLQMDFIPIAQSLREICGIYESEE